MELGGLWGTAWKEGRCVYKLEIRDKVKCEASAKRRWWLSWDVRGVCPESSAGLSIVLKVRTGPEGGRGNQTVLGMLLWVGCWSFSGTELPRTTI